MKVVCIRHVEGFTVGKTYKVISCAGEYIQLKDDLNNKVIVFESCFDIV